MKNFKILSIAMLSFAALCVTSCGDDDVEEQKPKDGTEKPEEPKEPEEPEETSTTANLLTENGYYDGLMYYKITSNSPLEVCVAKADEVAVTIEIPMVVMIDEKKYSCTSIGEKAFSECKKLTSITIPNSVTSIGDYAFSGCKRLTSITIPNSVTNIRGGAFYDCSSLTSITIPNSVTSIGVGAFYSCTSLASITIPNSVTSIGNYAFQGCTGLKSIHCKPVAPPEINRYTYYLENNNYIYSQATLYVPIGSLDAYKNADYWKYFKNIEEEE